MPTAQIIHPFIASSEEYEKQFHFSVELMKAILQNHHPLNRRKDVDRINAVRTDIRSGRWNPFAGNVVKFNVLGDMIDGHHRTKAHILENVPMISSVIYGLPLEAIHYQDINRSRSAADNAVMYDSSKKGVRATDDDFKASRTRYAIAYRMMIAMRYKNGETSPSRYASPFEKTDFINGHPYEMKFAVESHQSDFMRPSVCAVLGIFYSIAPQSAVKFRDQLIRGISASPIVVALRDYLLTHSKGGNQVKYDYFNTLHAVNLFHNKLPLDKPFSDGIKASWAIG